MADFDTSQEARLLLEQVLIRHTFYGNNAANEVQNTTARRNIIERLFNRLNALREHPKVRFEMLLNASHVFTGEEPRLFTTIANIICRNSITDFHAMVHGIPVNHWEQWYKQVYSWKYRQYEFRAYTRRIFNGNDFYMEIRDTSKQQEDDSDSDNDTDHDSVKEPWDPPLQLMFTAIESLHNRLASLEAKGLFKTNSK